MKNVIETSLATKTLLVFRLFIACGVLLMTFSGLLTNTSFAKSNRIEFREVKGIYEPSGILQLSDGRVLVIEDESTRPFTLLTRQKNRGSFTSARLRPRSLLEPAAGRLDDLEGVTVGPQQFVYAITSHSRKKNDKRDANREKLIRFKIHKDHIIASQVNVKLRHSLSVAFPALKEAGKKTSKASHEALNIEGLVFDPDGTCLWLAFRAPLVDQKALLIAILNPIGVFERDEAFRFSKDPLLLDLDGGGIRDLVYDPLLKGYLIVSQREGTKNEKAFKLWFWNGDPTVLPKRVRIEGVKDLERVEGVAPVKFDGEHQLLLMSDDGIRAQRKAASYLIVNYNLLTY